MWSISEVLLQDGLSYGIHHQKEVYERYKDRDMVEGSRVDREKREKGKKAADVRGKEKEKKRRQFRPSTVALWEIHKFKKNYWFPYQEVTISEGAKGDCTRTKGNLRFQALTLLALQEVADAYVVNLFEDITLCVVHAKHINLMSKDI